MTDTIAAQLSISKEQVEAIVRQLVEAEQFAVDGQVYLSRLGIFRFGEQEQIHCYLKAKTPQGHDVDITIVHDELMRWVKAYLTARGYAFNENIRVIPEVPEGDVEPRKCFSLCVQDVRQELDETPIFVMNKVLRKALLLEKPLVEQILREAIERQYTLQRELQVTHLPGCTKILHACCDVTTAKQDTLYLVMKHDQIMAEITAWLKGQGYLFREDFLVQASNEEKELRVIVSNVVVVQEKDQAA